MTLVEILRINSTSGINSDAFDYENATIVGDFERNDIWNIKSTEPGTEMFAIKQNNNIVSYIVGHFWDDKGQRYFVLADAQTQPAHQKQGLVTSLYMFFIKKKNIKIISDKEQTPQGEQLWRSLARQFSDRIKIMDTSTKQTFSLEEIPLDMVYVNGSKDSPESQRYRLVLEDLLDCGIPHVGYDIVKENVIYTDPNKYGIFD